MNYFPSARLAILSLLAALGTVLPVVAAEPNPATNPPKDETLVLPKFQVKGNIICSFGIGIVATWNKETQTIGRMFVDDVSPGSDAALLGLQRGDEILSINGKKITEMQGGTKRGSDLFDLLVNQPLGRTIEVEVAVRVVKRVSLVASQ